MKKTAMAILGGLAIMLCGMILAALVSQVPIGCSDADLATVGRKFYYGLPWPCFVSEGSGSMGAWGQTLEHFPVNALFWTVVVAVASCLPGRQIRWWRIVGVTVAQAVLLGACAVFCVR